MTANIRLCFLIADAKNWFLVQVEMLEFETSSACVAPCIFKPHLHVLPYITSQIGQNQRGNSSDRFESSRLDHFGTFGEFLSTLKS